MSRKPSSAFVTTRKGFCYLTVKVGRGNYNIMRIRNYTIEPQDKRDMRRLYPDYLYWSGNTRNWSPVSAVTLNPERDSIIKAHSAHSNIQALAA